MSSKSRKRRRRKEQRLVTEAEQLLKGPEEPMFDFHELGMQSALSLEHYVREHLGRTFLLAPDYGVDLSTLLKKKP